MGLVVERPLSMNVPKGADYIGNQSNTLAKRITGMHKTERNGPICRIGDWHCFDNLMCKLMTQLNDMANALSIALYTVIQPKRRKVISYASKKMSS